MWTHLVWRGAAAAPPMRGAAAAVEVSEPGSAGDAVEPVAGVAQAGHDVGLLVQPLVDGGQHDGDVGLRQLILAGLQPFGRGKQADAGDVGGARARRGT